MGWQRLASPDLGRIFRGETISGLSEWQLLERYLERRDEAAFEALVCRHGPMVLGVCRRMLLDQADVEDAFQATFLVLVRRARHLGPRDAIGPWLYGVAARVALRARAQAARRRRHEPLARGFPAVAPIDRSADPELGAVLDQELGRLPGKYRSPLVLCYLEGRTHEEAARQLKWPVGTVKGRLARGRDLLRSRLVRRGLAPTAGALTMLLSPDASAAIQQHLVDSTVGSCSRIAAGQSTIHVVSASIHSLVEGVLAAMILHQLKWVGLTVLTVIALTGAGVMARHDDRSHPDPAPAAAPAASQTAGSKPVPATPAPAAAPAAPPAGTAPPSATPAAPPAAPAEPSDRTSQSTGLNAQFVQAARSAYQATWEAFRSGSASEEQVYEASRRWLEAQSERVGSFKSRVAAQTAHLDRIRDLVRAEGDRPHSPAKAAAVARVKAYEAEARLRLAEANASRGGGEADNGSEPGSGRGQDPRSRRIHQKLEEPIAMPFRNETPLDDVLKYIKQATTSSDYPGIPIYVEPLGLQDAERSLNSTINIDLEGIPLRRTLQLSLAQLGLVYFVDDGILVITSPERAELPLPPSMSEPAAIMQDIERAERGELKVERMKELIEVLKTRNELRKLLEHGRGGDLQ
jgi:RNA polymerase sigma factor (sigma-70 family)